jgi:hypothetical protein
MVPAGTSGFRRWSAERRRPVRMIWRKSGLLFKLLAPMRNVAVIENCARGIDAMAREEAAYWLGMAMHRKNPRRVLAALRLLLSAT